MSEKTADELLKELMGVNMERDAESRHTLSEMMEKNETVRKVLKLFGITRSNLFTVRLPSDIWFTIAVALYQYEVKRPTEKH